MQTYGVRVGATMLPELSDAQRARQSYFNMWDIPKGLEGKVVKSLEGLRALLPPDKTYDQVRKVRSNEPFPHYCRPEKGSSFGLYVAYECPSCKKIYMERPQVETSSIDDGYPTAGREGIDYYCIGCHRSLGEHTISLS